MAFILFRDYPFTTLNENEFAFRYSNRWFSIFQILIARAGLQLSPASA